MEITSSCDHLLCLIIVPSNSHLFYFNLCVSVCDSVQFSTCFNQIWLVSISWILGKTLRELFHDLFGLQVIQRFIVTLIEQPFFFLTFFFLLPPPMLSFYSSVFFQQVQVGVLNYFWNIQFSLGNQPACLISKNSQSKTI